MFKTTAKIASLAIALGVFAGCSANKEMVEADHLRIQELDKLVQAQGKKILEVELTANNALAEANNVAATAAEAKAMAQKCHQACEAHMDKVFHKSMMK